MLRGTRETNPGTAPCPIVREWPALAGYALLFAAAWAVVEPWANAPAIDDWVYAWSVEHLVATGELRVLAFSAVYPITTALWAALFAWTIGFSFVALRLATVVLAVLGCWALYLTLRELGCRRGTSLLGGTALALHPVYFALSFSFMTETPFVALATAALYCYVRAIRRRETTALWAGGAFAIAAFGVRPLAIGLPLAVVPALIGRRGWRDTPGVCGLAVAVPLAIMVTLQLGLPRLLGPLDWAAIRAGYLHYWFTVPLGTYAGWTVDALVQAALPFAALLLTGAVVGRAVMPAAGAAVLLGAAGWFALGEVVTPLSQDQTWSLREITARSMIDGDLPTPGWIATALPFVRAVALLTAGALVVLTARAWRRAPEWAGPASVVAAYAGLQVAAINVLWLYNDRYYVALAPALAIAGAWALDGSRRGGCAAAALLLVMAGVDVTGTRDMLAFNRACDEAVRALEASGIPAYDIDGGYALNGWRLYAHPEHLPPGADPRTDVPFVTSKASTRFALTNTPLPADEVIRTIPLPRATWQATRVLYVVRRVPSPPGFR